MSLYRRGDRAIHGTIGDELETERDRIEAAFDAVTPGMVFFVNSNIGSNAKDGFTWATALATITEALARCVSGRGDRIYVAGGAAYGENLVVTKDGIQLIGAELGGYQRPDIGAAGGRPLSVHAQAFVASHLRFAAAGAFDAVRQQGNGYIYHDCVVDGAGLNGMALLPDLDDDSYSASEGLLSGCLFRGATAKGLLYKNPGPGVEGGVGPTDVEVRGCRFYSNGMDIGDEDTAGSNDTTFLNCLVENCDFLTPGGGAFVYVNLSAGGNNRGMLSHCKFNEPTLVAAQIVAPAAVALVGAMDAQGIVDASAF
jgi:hypothetical protein